MASGTFCAWLKRRRLAFGFLLSLPWSHFTLSSRCIPHHDPDEPITSTSLSCGFPASSPNGILRRRRGWSSLGRERIRLWLKALGIAVHTSEPRIVCLTKTGMLVGRWSMSPLDLCNSASSSLVLRNQCCKQCRSCVAKNACSQHPTAFPKSYIFAPSSRPCYMDNSSSLDINARNS